MEAPPRKPKLLAKGRDPKAEYEAKKRQRDNSLHMLVGNLITDYEALRNLGVPHERAETMAMEMEMNLSRTCDWCGKRSCSC